MPSEESPEWLENTAIGAVGVVTMVDGERVAAELVDFDLERNELVVDIISPTDHRASAVRGRRAIPAELIAAFAPRPREAQPWPYSDPCRSSPVSLARLSLMAALFLCTVVGGFILFLLWANRPFGIQGASAIAYTFAQTFLTFAATRGWHRFSFTCPAVRPQIPRLLRRHAGFLIALFVLQTSMLDVRPILPVWWTVADAKGSTPFELALLLLSVGLGYAQVFTSRRLLDRAHRKFSS